MKCTKQVNIVHISNTDINSDSRIRKELNAINNIENVKVTAIGISEENRHVLIHLEDIDYNSIRLFSRMLSITPRPIRYIFELIEFTIKAVMKGKALRPDVVHSHDTFALPAGWILKKLIGCKLIYDAHELESDKNGQNSLLSFATLTIEKKCWKQIDLLISVSDSITEWYTRNLGPKPSTLILNSPVISSKNSQSTSPDEQNRYFHEKFNIPSTDLIFVYLGILGFGRGIEMCLEAFSKASKNTHVVFIGFGPLQQLIMQHSEMHHNIHFHQAVPHDQVVSLVRNADYGLCLIEKVSLSDYYCLPNKLFEYCFARVPVLASNFPEISKLVEKYSLGVCCHPDAESVRIALNRLIGNRPSRSTVDISELSWETQATRLISSYKDLLKTSSSLPSNH